MRAPPPNGCQPRHRRFGRAAALGEGAVRRRRNDGRAVSGGRERMGKRLLGWYRRVWWKMVAFLLVFFVSLLAWVTFGSLDDCRHNTICYFLGVTEKTEAIKLLGLAIAGVVVFWGGGVANRRADAMADSAKATAASARAAGASAKATEAGNRQRAFKDGVEHLGSGKSSVRQGGAHALFHLALEDEKLRASIASVLCAHIRETTSDKDYQKKNKDKPSTEMQSLLRLLFTTETVNEGRMERFWEGITPDLEGGYFRSAELSHARFRGAKLNSAQFQGASLEKAQFQGASLGRAQFQRASLGRAQFQRAWLDRAQFQWASLGRAQFQQASLREAQFQWASLGRAQFQQASLREAQFQGASLKGAQFQGASLEGAQFQGASLREAQFQGASLREAQFQGASLREAQFQGASLREAQFQGASLREAQFQGASLEGAQFQGASLYMAGLQQAKFGQGSEHGDIPVQDRAVAKSGELVEKLKASTFHGVSSEPSVLTSFEERINDRTDKESDFSGVIFKGGVTQELLAGAKKALGLESPLLDDPDCKERLIPNLQSEIDQSENNTPPKEVIAGSYDKEDAERWIREFREVMAKIPETNQAA